MIYCGLCGGVMSCSSPEPGSPFVLFSFFHFIRRFWNQILICLSVKHNACAISIRLLRVRQRLKWNSFSSSSVWYRVQVCRPRFLSKIEQKRYIHQIKSSISLDNFIIFLLFSKYFIYLFGIFSQIKRYITHVLIANMQPFFINICTKVKERGRMLLGFCQKQKHHIVVASKNYFLINVFPKESISA